MANLPPGVHARFAAPHAIVDVVGDDGIAALMECAKSGRAVIPAAACRVVFPEGATVADLPIERTPF